MAWDSLRRPLTFLPRWSFSRWLLVARLLQAAGTLVTALLNGFLLVYTHINRLGFADSMFALELMACAAFIYSSIVLLMQHAGSPRRRSSAALIRTFLVCDVLFNGLMLAIMTVLARMGLPIDCHGLTRLDVEKGDAPDNPPPGYDTIRFGDEDLRRKGVLDKYCPLERSFYFIAAALILTYMLTVTLGALRLFEMHWKNNCRMDPLYDNSSDDFYHLDRVPKVQSPVLNSRDVEDIGPSSEGVLTPRSRTSPSLQTRGIGSSSSNEANRDRVFREQARTQPLPVSPVSAASPISQVSPISPVPRQHRGSFIGTATLNTAPDTSLGIMPMIIDPSTESAAEAAMVTDGYRHPRQDLGRLTLPPYSPGQARGQYMSGHGDESNEMRLSEYVKGERRAQDMKDSGVGL